MSESPPPLTVDASVCGKSTSLPGSLSEQQWSPLFDDDEDAKLPAVPNQSSNQPRPPEDDAALLRAPLPPSLPGFNRPRKASAGDAIIVTDLQPSTGPQQQQQQQQQQAGSFLSASGSVVVPIGGRTRHHGRRGSTADDERFTRVLRDEPAVPRNNKALLMLGEGGVESKSASTKRRAQKERSSLSEDGDEGVADSCCAMNGCLRRTSFVVDILTCRVHAPMIHPASSFKMRWNLLVLLLLLYYAFAVPVHIVFGPRRGGGQSDGLLGAELLFDALLFVDIGISCCTGFYQFVGEHGNKSVQVVNMRRRASLRAYVRSWLVFDVLGALPCAAIVAGCPISWQWSRIFYLLKLIRVAGFTRFTSVWLKHFSHLVAHYELARVPFISLILCHYMGSLFYLVGEAAYTSEGTSWIVDHGVLDSNPSDRYVSPWYCFSRTYGGTGRQEVLLI